MSKIGKKSILGSLYAHVLKYMANRDFSRLRREGQTKFLAGMGLWDWAAMYEVETLQEDIITSAVIVSLILIASYIILGALVKTILTVWRYHTNQPEFSHIDFDDQSFLSSQDQKNT